MDDCLSDRCNTPTLPQRLQLRPVEGFDVGQLMSWFPDEAALRRWSPNNTFPLEPARFAEQARLATLDSRVLVDRSGAVVGFGQYSDRGGCCHLSRLVVRPERRSEGLGSTLITLLAAEGTQKLNFERLALLVNRDNVRALQLYLRLGFDFAPFSNPVALHRAKAYYLQAPYPLPKAG